MKYFQEKTVLVTGGGGSIGSELCRQLYPHVKELRIMGHSELPLYTTAQELPGCVAVLGSVTNQDLTAQAAAGCDLVIHAAAHKHVPMCERNFLEAIRNNVGGTASVILAARAAGAQLVAISTDKAVRPTSVMGMTKRAAELLLYAEMRRSVMTEGAGQAVSTVRFGNVLGSSGSVLPLWDRQVAQGGPITVTDRRCTRYFMSIQEACQLVLGVAGLNQLGTFVLDMGEQHSIWDMAQARAQRAYMAGQGRIEVIETGLRPGEKLAEELVTESQWLRRTRLERVRLVDELPSGDAAAVHSLLFSALLGDKAKAMGQLREVCRD